MKPGGRLLCAVDRDARARALVACARQWAGAMELEAVFVHACDNGTPPRRVHDDLAALGIAAEELRVVRGGAADVILETIRTEEPDVVLLASSSSDDSHVGSLCTTLLREAPRPLVVMPPGGEDSFTGGPVACAVSLGRDDEVAVRFASALASLTGRRLMLTNVVSASDAARLAAARARGALITDDARRRAAVPLAERLVAVAREGEADAIVLGSASAEGRADGVVSSVARSLWTTSPCPVVVVDA